MSCSYAQPSARKRQTPSTSSSNTPTDMQNRIDRLEGLVLSLMTNGSQSDGPAAAQRALSLDSSATSQQQQDVDVNGGDGSGMQTRGDGSEESETDQVGQSLGVMKVDNNKSMYYGNTHWATILSDVSHHSHFELYARSLTETRSLRLRITSMNSSTRSNSKTKLRR